MSRRLMVPIIAAAAILLFLSAGCTYNAAQVNKTVIGARTWQQWLEETGWCSCEADDYTPVEETIRVISEMAREQNASFLVFGGSWCPDTRSQLPVIFKIFDLASIQQDKIKLYGVDGEKQEPSGTAAKFGIRRVPTVIVLVSGKEIGRITEYPEDSWENDLMGILSR